jgi:hypothetical protein
MESNRKHDRPAWPPETFAPLSPPTRILARSDDAQLRLTFLPTVGPDGGLDVRLYRKSPAEVDDLEAYGPTAAGLVIPRCQLREFAGMLAEIIAELEQ